MGVFTFAYMGGDTSAAGSDIVVPDGCHSGDALPFIGVLKVTGGEKALLGVLNPTVMGSWQVVWFWRSGTPLPCDMLCR